MKMKICTYASACLIIAIRFNVNAQGGFSSASLSMNRSNEITSPKQVIVEEYLNYHKHKIPLPKAGEEVALDLQWGLMNLAENSAVLQVGIATGHISDSLRMPPINLCLVIDRSGSMASENKLEKIKGAAIKLISRLRPEDIVSVVAYDGAADIVLLPEKAGSLDKIRLAIEGIQTGGSTNINAGMIAGYEEVLKNYKPNNTNRVILLTDGIANAGQVLPDSIAANSLRYNKRGVDISTIGIGSDINYGLLQQIAKAGRALNHFVGNDDEDIKKVFDEELESLLSPIANDVSLEIEYPANAKVEGVLGYAPVFETNKIRFALDNMNSGLTEVVLIKLKSSDPTLPLSVSAKLIYTSHAGGKKSKILKESKIGFSQNYMVQNDEVKKNYMIGFMAQSLKEVADLLQKSETKKAYDTAVDTMNEVDNQYPDLKDNDIKRVKDILAKNFTVMVNWKKA